MKLSKRDAIKVKGVLFVAALALIYPITLFVRATRTGPVEDMPGPVVKISVARTGAIRVDGSLATLVQLEAVREHLKASDGVVWFYREKAVGKEPPEIMKVIRFFLDHGVPMSLSSRPDFSDYVDRKGRSHPRRRP